MDTENMLLDRVGFTPDDMLGFDTENSIFE